MTDLNFDELHQHKTQILALCQKYHASNVRVFGSVARGDNQAESDIDLLIDMPNHISFLRLVALHQELFELLGKKVDIAIERNLPPLIKEQVLRDARRL
jgi:predicted nucleotidyltransferase